MFFIMRCWNQCSFPSSSSTYLRDWSEVISPTGLSVLDSTCTFWLWLSNFIAWLSCLGWRVLVYENKTISTLTVCGPDLLYYLYCPHNNDSTFIFAHITVWALFWKRSSVVWELVWTCAVFFKIRSSLQVWALYSHNTTLSKQRLQIQFKELFLQNTFCGTVSQ